MIGPTWHHLYAGYCLTGQTHQSMREVKRFQFTIEGGPRHGNCLRRPGGSWPEGAEVSQDSGNGAQRVVHQQRPTLRYSKLAGGVA